MGSRRACQALSWVVRPPGGNRQQFGSVGEWLSRVTVNHEHPRGWRFDPSLIHQARPAPPRPKCGRQFIQGESVSAFKQGQKVRFQTPQGRSGQGKISDINSTAKGAWYSVKADDGTVTKVRAAGLTAT